MTQEDLRENPRGVLSVTDDERAPAFLAKYRLLDPLLGSLARLRSVAYPAVTPPAAAIGCPADPTHWIVGFARSESGSDIPDTISAFAFPKCDWSGLDVTSYLRKLTGSQVVWQEPVVDPGFN